MSRKVPVHSSGKVVGHALVDEKDFQFVNQFRWRLEDGYAVATIRMHQLVQEKEPGKTIDHKNRTKLDNRRRNLRSVTHIENMQNQGSRGGTSRHRGVHWNAECGKWHAQATFYGVRFYLGLYDDEDEAASAVDKFLKKKNAEIAKTRPKKRRKVRVT